MKYIGLALVLLSIAPRGLSAAPPQAAEPQWLVDARAKEGKLTEPHLVTSADNAVSFSIPVALAEKITSDKDSYSVLLSLGPDVFASCELLTRDADVAALLQESAKTTFAEVIDGKMGKLEKTAVERIDAAVAGGTPFLSISWLYRVNQGKSGPKLGSLRQVAASRGGHAIYCAMMDLGYAQTFDAAVRSLIGTLKRKDDDEPPYYSEASLASIGDARIGFNTVGLWRDKDGDTKYVDTTAFLVARTADTVQAQDSTDVQFITPDGEMINAKRVASSDGNIEMNLDLAATDDSKWSVKGKFRGKDVKETIEGGSPGTFVSQAAALRTLLAKKEPVGAEARLSDWSATDPVHFSQSTVKVLSASDGGAYHVRVSGALTSEMTVEGATGLVTRATFQVGPGTVTAERVYVQGKL